MLCCRVVVDGIRNPRSESSGHFVFTDKLTGNVFLEQFVYSQIGSLTC